MWEKTGREGDMESWMKRGGTVERKEALYLWLTF